MDASAGFNGLVRDRHIVAVEPCAFETLRFGTTSGTSVTGISTVLIIEPSFALYSNTWIVPGCSASIGTSTCVLKSPRQPVPHVAIANDSAMTSPLPSSTRMFTVASKTSAFPAIVTGLVTRIPDWGSATAIGASSAVAAMANPGRPSNGMPFVGQTTRLRGRSLLVARNRTTVISDVSICTVPSTTRTGNRPSPRCTGPERYEPS